MDTSVVLFLYRRPDTTARVCEAIRRARPRRLFLVADAPRPDDPSEALACSKARAAAARVRWDCEVLHDYASEHLGCKRRVATGLDWVFEHVEEAIILEDDCVPHPSFFPYCEALLERFRHDERVMMICGTNVNLHWKSDRQDYHFSRFGGAWGWATWRAAWSRFDPDMSEWADADCRRLVRSLIGAKAFEVRSQHFDQVYHGAIDTWDWIWNFYRLINAGLSVIPAKNLVANIGFGPGALHTRQTRCGRAELATFPLPTPLRANPIIIPDAAYDYIFLMGMKAFLTQTVHNPFRRLPSTGIAAGAP